MDRPITVVISAGVDHTATTEWVQIHFLTALSTQYPISIQSLHLSKYMVLNLTFEIYCVFFPPKKLQKYLGLVTASLYHWEIVTGCYVFVGFRLSGHLKLCHPFFKFINPQTFPPRTL